MTEVDCRRRRRAPAKPHQIRRAPLFFFRPLRQAAGLGADKLDTRALGRSHRASSARRGLQDAIERTRAMLGLPADHRIGIVPASDTGAFEMAMWSLLGAAAGDHAGLGELRRRLGDRRRQAAQARCRRPTADYGEICRSRRGRPASDVVFTWNGTTSGVRVPERRLDRRRPRGPDHLRRDLGGVRSGHRLGEDRCRHLLLAEGAWRRGRARHAGPRPARGRAAGERPAAWPLPKIFRLTKGGKLIDGIFKGETINTPSMLAVEDWLFALEWAERIGGLEALIARADANAAALDRWVAERRLDRPSRRRSGDRSKTSVCLQFADRSDAEANQRAAEGDRPSCSSRRTRPTTSPAIATRRRACASGAARPSRPPTSRRSALARLGVGGERDERSR